MIHKKAIYGKTADIMVCEMGTGDVRMIGSEKGKNGEVILALKTSDEPNPINVIQKAGFDSFDEMEPELVFIFNKVESIESMISMLEDCRDTMLDKDKEG